jgi:hypothetical protein
MAIVSVTVKEWSVSTTRYNIIVLLSVFGVYIYRDIWPLATFTKEPKDLQEGYLLWIKFSITTLAAVIIPLFIPRQYVPVDPKVRQCCFCYFRSSSFFNNIGSNARTKSRTDMLTLCINILYISGPGYNAWISRSTFAIRSTSSSFGFGLFPIYHKARISGSSLSLMQVKTRAKL